MDERVSATDYQAGMDDPRRRELVWGYFREPAAPRLGHQSVVTRTTMLLDLHVRAHALGVVCVAPVDVVLDRPNALILQPDVIFVSNDRTAIVRDQVLGAPDLVVELVSPPTEFRERAMKIEWYAQYGVRECWLVDPAHRTIVVMNLETKEERQFAGDGRIESWMLPSLLNTAGEFFE